MTRRRAQLTMAGLPALLALCAGGAAATATGALGAVASILGAAVFLVLARRAERTAKAGHRERWPALSQG